MADSKTNKPATADRKDLELYFDIFHLTISRERLSETWGSRVMFIVYFGYILLRDFFSIRRKNAESRLFFDVHVLYVHVETLNNYRTVSFLEKYFNTYFTTCIYNEVYPPNFINLRPLLNRKMNLKKYRFLWHVLLSPRYSIRYYKAIDIYFEFFETISNVFDHSRPGAFFFTNDHNPVARSIILACKEKRIPSFYYQHASVSSVFPPLKFRASFLFGQHFLNMYKLCGAVEGDIHLVGMTRFDTSRSIIIKKKASPVRKIGICYGIWDEISRVNRVVGDLLDSSCFSEVYVRPHPRDGRSIGSLFLSHDRLVVSDPQIEKPEKFLASVDAVVADTSGILLEAALMNVWPIQTNLRSRKNRRPDYYGFLHKGIIDECPDYRKITGYLSERRPASVIRDEACEFDASIGSPFEFAVEDRIIEILIQQYDFGKFKK